MKTLPAPPPTRIEEVVDILHGHRVTDPYRWLEDADNPDTIDWVAAQNTYTRSLLDAVAARGRIMSRLDRLLSIGTVAAPTARGDRYFYQRREGHQNQPVLYVREGVDGDERVLLDPNAES